MKIGNGNNRILLTLDIMYNYRSIGVGIDVGTNKFKGTWCNTMKRPINGYIEATILFWTFGIEIEYVGLGNNK